MKSNCQNLIEELSHLEIITDPEQVAKLSLDYYHFSPILEAQLQDKRADLVIRPHNSQEVIDIAKTCVKYQIPLT
ncbi:MAG: FAD-binding protein, partial [Microcystis panniformis]